MFERRGEYGRLWKARQGNETKALRIGEARARPLANRLDMMA
jgi:hypothetical protein